MAEQGDWHDEIAELAEQSMAGEGTGPLIIADFGGTCPLCGLRWQPGDLIGYDPDEDAWCHAEHRL